MNIDVSDKLQNTMAEAIFKATPEGQSIEIPYTNCFINFQVQNKVDLGIFGLLIAIILMLTIPTYLIYAGQWTSGILAFGGIFMLSCIFNFIKFPLTANNTLLNASIGIIFMVICSVTAYAIEKRGTP
jgi:hypothetical protein